MPCAGETLAARRKKVEPTEHLRAVLRSRSLHGKKSAQHPKDRMLAREEGLHFRLLVSIAANTTKRREEGSRQGGSRILIPSEDYGYTHQPVVPQR